MPHFSVYNYFERMMRMEIKERLNRIRKHLHLTQQEFADKLGVKRNTVATYETGKSNPSDSAVALICKEFNVNEEWLRNGTGEMFRADPSDILQQLAYKYHLSEADCVVIEKFVNMRPEARKALFSYMQEVITSFAYDNTVPHDPAYARIEPPQPADHIMETIKSQQKEDAILGISLEQAEAEYIKKISSSAKNMGSIASNTTEDTDTPTEKEKASGT